MRTPEEFWARVDRSAGPTGCWPWLGARKGTSGRLRDQYGMVQWHRKMFHAHRLALLLAVGPPPPGKPHALHRCDNPPCCNPIHLEWGSPKDNMDQMTARGHRRAPHHNGEKNGRAKLTWEAVQAIRMMPESLTQSHLAAWFGVSSGTISKIRLGRTWRSR